MLKNFLLIGCAKFGNHWPGWIGSPCRSDWKNDNY